MLFVETDYIAIPHTETGGVEVEFGLLLRGNTYAKLHGLCWVFEQRVEREVLVFVVEHRHHIGEAVVEKTHDVLDILLPLVAIADYEDVLVNKSLFV